METTLDRGVLEHIAGFLGFGSRFALSTVSRPFRAACAFGEFARRACLRPEFVRDAVIAGDIIAVKFDIARAPHRAQEYLLAAAKCGDLRIVKLVHPLARHCDFVAACLAFGSGNLPCAAFFLSLPIALNSAHVDYAARSGNVEIFDAVWAKFHPADMMAMSYAMRLAYMSGSRPMIDRVAEVAGPGTWNDKLLGACAGGHAGLVAEAITDGADNFAEAFIEACRHGHDEIAAVIERDHGITGINANWLLHVACIGCRPWAIKRSLSLGASEWTGGLESACGNRTSRGIVVARDMISRGAIVDKMCVTNICTETDDLDGIRDLDFARYIIGQIGEDDLDTWGAAIASSMSYAFPEVFDIVTEEYERRVGKKISMAPDIANQLLHVIARSCNESAIDVVLGYGADDYECGLVSVCGSGNSGAEYIADKFIALGARDFDSGLQSACNGGNSAMAAAMIARGATDFNSALRFAAQNGHYRCVVEMLEHGADDIEGAITAATANNRADMAEFLTARL